MSQDESDKNSVGFINGRPARVEVDGKITYLDDGEKPKSKADKEKQPRKTSPFVKWARLIIGIAVLGLIIKFLIIPFFETGGGNADTREVPGDATHFDPIASF